MSAIGAIVPTTTSITIENNTRADLKKTIKGFWATLSNMGKTYADEDLPLEIDGKTIPAEQKYGAAGAYLFQTHIDKIMRRHDSVMQIYNMVIKMEKVMYIFSNGECRKKSV